MIETHELDLKAYLARIGHAGSLDPCYTTLESLQIAHLASIPFENVDVRLGRPIRLDLGSLEMKLVRRGRGGYCFEQNTMFAAVLQALGFEVRPLEARVRPPGASTILPRTHMLLRVDVDDHAWIADVGFGADGPLQPVPLGGARSEQPDAVYEVTQEDGGVHVLRRLLAGEWQDLYAFTLGPALPVDFEVTNHFTSTHPHSVFVNTLTVQRSEISARHILRGHSYTVRRGEDEVRREVTAEELPCLLREELGLDLSADDVVAALG